MLMEMLKKQDLQFFCAFLVEFRPKPHVGFGMAIGSPPHSGLASDLTPRPPAGQSAGSARAMPEDYYSVLSDMIDKAVHDPVQIRHIVYALAWHHFRAEAMFSPAIPNAQSRAKTVWALERARELEDAIERLEAQATRGVPDGDECDPGLSLQRGIAL